MKSPVQKELQLTLADGRVRTINLGKLPDEKIAARCAEILAAQEERITLAEVHASNQRAIRTRAGWVVPGYWTTDGKYHTTKVA